MPGRITTPSVLWKFALGGGVVPAQFIRAKTQERVFLVLSTGDRAIAYTVAGDELWTARYAKGISLLGSWDVTGEGDEEILAISANSLIALDAKTGALTASIEVPSTIGALKIVDADGDGIRDIFWAPAASSRVVRYSFAGGKARAVWDIEPPNYQSDPYGPSGMTIGRLSSGIPVIYMVGGRGQIVLMMIDVRTGVILSRRNVMVGPGHGTESGGPRQRLDLRAGPSGVRLLMLSEHLSNQQYMFQGAVSVNASDLSDSVVLDSYPVGLHFVDGSVADFDGDGADEILVSRFDPASSRHELLLLDAKTLSIRSRRQDFYLRAIVPRSGGTWTIIGHTSVRVEVPPVFGSLLGCTLEGSVFTSCSFRVERAAVPALHASRFDDPVTVNGGDRAVILSPGGSDSKGILIAFDENANGIPSQFAAADVEDGQIRSRYVADKGVVLYAVADKPAEGSEARGLYIGRTDGWAVRLDESLAEISRLRFSTFSTNSPGNGHTTEIAGVADLEGSGRPDVVVVDSASRLLRLDVRDADLLHPPKATVLWSVGVPQEIISVPRARGMSLIVRRRIEGIPTLASIDARGGVQWEHRFGTVEGLPEDTMPSGMNWARIGSSLSIVVSGGPSNVFPMRTYLFDSVDGSLLWKSNVGTFWDATFAIADFNGDLSDDVISNLHVYKGSVVDGKTGALIGGPVVLPPYRTLGSVDYNGVPIVAAIEGHSVLVLNAKDDAHMALLRYPRSISHLRHREPEIVWTAEQRNLDDEWESSPAVAPLNGSWVVAVGSRSGHLRARRGLDGSLMWEVFLGNGAIRSSTTAGFPLSSVVANDVDADGVVDFVVAGADGFVYAIDSAKGGLKWSLDLGAACGSPIAADVDGDGASEVLVPSGGFLYAIGQAR